MTFSVRLSRQAQKFFKKQDAHIQLRLREGLAKLHEPFVVVEHFEGNCYKLRIGEYRALVDIDIKEKK